MIARIRRVDVHMQAVVQGPESSPRAVVQHRYRFAVVAISSISFRAFLCLCSLVYTDIYTDILRKESTYLLDLRPILGQLVLIRRHDVLRVGAHLFLLQNRRLEPVL